MHDAKWLCAKTYQFLVQINRASRFADDQTMGQVDIEGIRLRIEELEKSLHWYRESVLDIFLTTESNIDDEDPFEEYCFVVIAKMRDIILASEKPYLSVTHHINAILDYQPVSKCTAFELQRLVFIVRQNLKALKALGEPIEHWDTIIIFVLLQKVDSYTRQLYNNMMEQDIFYLPSLEGFLKFLEKTAKSLEERRSLKVNPYGNPPQYPPPQNQPIYPQIYNPASAPPPGQPGGYPGQPAGYPAPGQQYPYQQVPQPGFTYPGQPGIAPSAPMAAAPASFSYAGYPTVTPQPGYGPQVEWIPTTSRDAASLSDRAVVAGYEGHDGSPLWAIRSRFQGDLIPGKLAIKHQSAYVPWGGNENCVQNIEVCCARPDRVRWIECRDGAVPPNAVIGGNTSDGEPLYVGRTKHERSLTPGKVHQSHKAMYISFAGKELPFKTYEVLCTI